MSEGSRVPSAHRATCQSSKFRYFLSPWEDKTAVVPLESFHSFTMGLLPLLLSPFIEEKSTFFFFSTESNEVQALGHIPGAGLTS